MLRLEFPFLFDIVEVIDLNYVRILTRGYLCGILVDANRLAKACELPDVQELRLVFPICFFLFQYSNFFQLFFAILLVASPANPVNADQELAFLASSISLELDHLCKCNLVVSVVV